MMNELERGYLGNPNLRRAGDQHNWTQKQLNEFIKCSQDVEYFITNYVKIVTLDKGLVTWEPYEFQKEMVKNFHDKRYNLVMTGRQCGKSTTVAAYICHYIIFNQHKNAAIIANKGATAREILSRVQLAYEHLPKWMQQGVVTWNKGSFELENGCKVMAAATSSSAIRGFSINLLFMDEVAFIPQNVFEDFFRSVYPTVSSGRSSKVIMVSTPNGLNHFYHMVKKAEDGLSDFYLSRYIWSDVPWRDEAWKQEQIKNTDPETFAQEHACLFIGGSNTLINPTILTRLKHVDPIEQQGGNNEFHIFEKPEKGKTYVITSDVSEGVKQDFSTFSVWKILEEKVIQVASFSCNNTDERILAAYLDRYGNLYNNAFILVENNKGQLTLNDLNETFEYENLVSLRSPGEKKTRLGMQMNRRTKKLACMYAKQMIETDRIKISCKRTLSELNSFVSNKNSYAAADGAHDDLIITVLLMAYFMNSEIFNDITDNPTSFKEVYYQDRIAKELEDLPALPVVGHEEKETIKKDEVDLYLERHF